MTPFDKGLGFVTLERQELITKLKAEFKNVSMDTPDTTISFERKIQSELRGLHKEEKLDDVTYKAIYPSGFVTPSSYPVIKAHKHTKGYPTRNITSHIESPQEIFLLTLTPFLNPSLNPTSWLVKTHPILWLMSRP
jgi:hypothetical protein